MTVGSQDEAFARRSVAAAAAAPGRRAARPPHAAVGWALTPSCAEAP